MSMVFCINIILWKEAYMVMIQCPECGCDISAEVLECPFCGCLIKVNNEMDLENNSSAGKQKFNYDIVPKYRIVSAFLFAAACILFVIALTRINNSDYKFYKEHYDQCMSGYDDSKYGERTSALLFKGTYGMIADEYKEMAEEDMSKIWKYRGQAIILAVCGTACIIVGCLLNKEAKEAIA